MTKLLYLPIEVRLRDIYPKLLIAKKALEHGFDVVIGDRYKIEELSFYAPPNIFFTRGLEAPVYEKLFPKLKKNRTVIVGQDVEAGQFLDNPPVYKFIRVREDRMKYLSTFFAWGKSEYKYLIDKYSNLNIKILLTGNPIFDIKKYKIETLQSKSNLKNYYLVNLSWALFRPISKIKENKTVQTFKLNGATQKDIKSHFDFGKQRIQENRSLLEAIKNIAYIFDDETFVIRPHPSDNLEVFKKNIKLPKNCKIIREDSVLNWISNAKKVIHPYCNSSIETLILGKIPICYDGFKKEKRELLLRKISNFADNTDTLLKLIKAEESKEMIKEKKDYLYSEFPNIHNQDASDLIISNVNSHKLKTGIIYKYFNSINLYVYCYYISLKSLIKKFVKAQNNEKLINKSDIFKIFKIYGIKSPYKVKKMSANLYKIYN